MMGLIDFVKDAGAKIGIGKKKDPRDEEIQEMMKAGRLRAHVLALGFDVENLNVAFDDGVATVSGTAKSQSEREKVVLALGNTDGVARVDDQMAVKEPEPEATFYTVEKGDSLSKIAKAIYGDAMKYPMIFEANKPMLTDPNLIYPGQVLRIPAIKK
jgi:nucleoid-associated protein YgaU